MEDTFVFENAEYEIMEDGLVRFLMFASSIDHFIVPKEVYNDKGRLYKLFLFSENHRHKPPKILADVISFDEPSEVFEVNTYFIVNCIWKFYLPRSIKHIKGSFIPNVKWPTVVLEENNKFVSVIGGEMLMNNHPLEILNHNFKRKRLIIRETTRFIGICAFQYNKHITTAVIPSSVEVINDYAFYVCQNLKAIKFKKNSHLRIISRFAFGKTAIRHISFPSTLEEIGENVFFQCKNISSAKFTEPLHLKKLGGKSIGNRAPDLHELTEEIQRSKTFNRRY